MVKPGDNMDIQIMAEEFLIAAQFKRLGAILNISRK
jgi:hypothetical protein